MRNKIFIYLMLIISVCLVACEKKANQQKITHSAIFSLEKAPLAPSMLWIRFDLALMKGRGCFQNHKMKEERITRLA